MSEFLNQIGLDTMTKKAIAAIALAGATVYVGYRFSSSNEELPSIQPKPAPPPTPDPIPVPPVSLSEESFQIDPEYDQKYELAQTVAAMRRSIICSVNPTDPYKGDVRYDLKLVV
jgi:hypothetical protein